MANLQAWNRRSKVLRRSPRGKQILERKNSNLESWIKERNRRRHTCKDSRNSGSSMEAPSTAECVCVALGKKNDFRSEETRVFTVRDKIFARLDLLDVFFPYDFQSWEMKKQYQSNVFKRGKKREILRLMTFPITVSAGHVFTIRRPSRFIKRINSLKNKMPNSAKCSLVLLSRATERWRENFQLENSVSKQLNQSINQSIHQKINLSKSLLINQSIERSTARTLEAEVAEQPHSLGGGPFARSNNFSKNQSPLQRGSIRSILLAIAKRENNRKNWIKKIP